MAAVSWPGCMGRRLNTPRMPSSPDQEWITVPTMRTCISHKWAWAHLPVCRIFSTQVIHLAHAQGGGKLYSNCTSIRVPYFCSCSEPPPSWFMGQLLRCPGNKIGSISLLICCQGIFHERCTDGTCPRYCAKRLFKDLSHQSSQQSIEVRLFPLSR